jgi:hypothetical protein
VIRLLGSFDAGIGHLDALAAKDDRRLGRPGDGHQGSPTRVSAKTQRGPRGAAHRFTHTIAFNADNPGILIRRAGHRTFRNPLR